MTLYLVRHGRPVIDADQPASTWPLDPAYAADIAALRPRLPRKATRWYSSPEVKAVETAGLLTPGKVAIVDDLREIERPTAVRSDDDESWADAVRRTLTEPDRPAHEGWETGADCRARLLSAALPLLPARGEHTVLVGHGTAWTILVAALTDTAPDLRRWVALGMPDVIRLEHRSLRLPADD